MIRTSICHWVILKNSGVKQSIFAPMGDQLSDFVRVGPAAKSSQFALPLVFAVEGNSAFGKDVPKKDRVLKFGFNLFRDEAEEIQPAFDKMDQTKASLLVSELSLSLADWVEEIGLEMMFLRPPSADAAGFEIQLQCANLANILFERGKCLFQTGLEMMAYSRGLKCVWTDESAL